MRTKTQGIMRVVLLLPILLVGIISCGFAKSQVLVGYVQVAEGSSWRFANSQSMRDAADAAGFQLIERKGGTIAEQIKQIEYLINQSVDAIAVAPVQADGWDAVLKEAQKENIPVIIMDRAVTSDKSLYFTYIGPDMNLEGQMAANWLIKKFSDKTGPIKLVELRGMEGSTPAINRHKGFIDIISKNNKFVIVQSQAADFNTARGKEVMANMLKSQKGLIDVVYAHNDDMAIGAIEAIKEYGKKPGMDIVVLSIDAMKTFFEAMVKGEANATVECNPLLGPYLMQAVRDHLAGREVPKWVMTTKDLYSQEDAAKQLPLRKY